MNGRNVALLTICAARVSSTKPMIEASDVPLSSCTRKPTVGGMRDAQRLRQDDEAKLLHIAERQRPGASHWPRGIASMQPRQISPRKALA